MAARKTEIGEIEQLLTVLRPDSVDHDQYIFDLFVELYFGDSP